MLAYMSPSKLAARRASTLDFLASEDSVVRAVGSSIIRLHCATLAPGAAPAVDLLKLADYFTRKRNAVRAHYFRQRYGRDYVTGERRHTRERVTHWNEGYQDEVEGSVFITRPPTWSRRRWKAYSLGIETARTEGR